MKRPNLSFSLHTFLTFITSMCVVLGMRGCDDSSSEYQYGKYVRRYSHKKWYTVELSTTEGEVVLPGTEEFPDGPWRYIGTSYVSTTGGPPGETYLTFAHPAQVRGCTSNHVRNEYGQHGCYHWDITVPHSHPLLYGDVHLGRGGGILHVISLKENTTGPDVLTYAVPYLDR